MQLTASERQLLRAYFLYDRLAGEDEAGRKKLFTLLKDIYCVTSSLNAAFKISESENVRAVNNLEKYARVRRLIEFSALSGGESPLAADEKEMLEIKADGMREAVERKLTRDDVRAGGLSLMENLKTQMKSENVYALTALGLFNIAGLFGCGDSVAAEWMLKKSAKWNNIEGLLCILKFFRDRREHYLPRFYTVCYQTAETELWQAAAKKYDVQKTNEELFNPETYLLEKLFTSDENYQREKYVATYARILNSTFLCYEDKKRALFSKNRDTITRISDLPLKDDIKKERKIDLAPLKGGGKLEEYILGILADFAGEGGKFPLIVGDAETQKQAKTLLLKSLKGFTVDVINAQYLTVNELQKTADNIFISKLTYSKDINTVFIIENLDKLAGNVAAEVGEFFDPAYRKIRITPFNVTLNLSGCKFIGLAAAKPEWIEFPADIFGQQKKRKLGFLGE